MRACARLEQAKRQRRTQINRNLYRRVSMATPSITGTTVRIAL
jgi:hypothetical protein